MNKRKLCVLWGVLVAVMATLSPSAFPSQVPYKAQEFLRYDLSYLGVKGGEALLEVPEKVFVGGHQVWHIRSEVRSTGWVRTFYKVQDTFDTYIDTETLLPLIMEKNIDERNYSRRKLIVFDHDTCQALYISDKYPQ